VTSAGKEGVAVAILKVLGMALAIGLLFMVAGAALTVPLERLLGQSAMAFTVGVTCAGAILGGIAGAAQAIVDVIAESKRASGPPS
jgi:hypothetical protein